MSKAKYWGSELVVKPKKPNPTAQAKIRIGNYREQFLNVVNAGRQRTYTTAVEALYAPMPADDANRIQWNPYADTNATPRPTPQPYTWESVYANNFTHNGDAVLFYACMGLIVKTYVTDPDSTTTLNDIVFRLGNRLPIIQRHYNRSAATVQAALEAYIIEHKRDLRILHEATTEEELMAREEEQVMRAYDDEEDDPDTNF